MGEKNVKPDGQITEYDRQLYPFINKSITIDENKIHFIDEGSGEIILFCHPPVTSSFMYRNMIPILSKKFRCIALDFPGFGLSRAAPGYEYSIKSQARIIEGFINQLALGPMYLVMQEIGGHAAISVFIKNPHWLKGIILTDTIIYPVSQYPKISAMLNIVGSSIFNLVNSNFNLVIKMLTSSGVKKRKMSPEEKQAYQLMFNNKRIRRISTKMLHQLVEEKQLLSEIQRAFETTFNRRPVLLIYGSDDSLSKLGIPQRIYELMPNAEMHWIEGEEHFPHEGAPEEMSNIITQWIEKYPNACRMQF